MKNKSINSTGELIRLYRNKKNMTQLELANKVGYEISQFICLIESNRSKLPFEKIDSFCKVLGIPRPLMKKTLLNEYSAFLDEVMA